MKRRFYVLMVGITLSYGLLEFTRSGEVVYVVASTLLAALLGLVHAKVWRYETAS